jgi:hypothetical protein
MHCACALAHKNPIYGFLPLGVASCCASIQLVPYDAVNRNKVSIRQLPLYFSSHSLHVSAPTSHLQVRYTIRYFKDYFYHNGSVALTQLGVEMLYVLYRCFDPWSPVHIIKLSTNIKIVKSLKFSVKTCPIYKM